VDPPRTKHLVLILARELASNLATPAVIADDSGVIVYYNEAAEEVAGRPFSQTGEVTLEDWADTFAPRSPDTDEPILPEERPATITLRERRAAHQRFRVTSRDDVVREVSVTAIPLFAHSDEFVGLLVFFWREED
jgi:PAS domain-containing protein